MKPSTRGLGICIAILGAAALGGQWAYGAGDGSVAAGGSTAAGSTDSPGAAIASPPATEPSPPWSLDPVVVTAQKRLENVQGVPRNVTAIPPEAIQNADIKDIQDAAHLAPDVTISHFANRRLSFPFVRGVGSGRNNPAVTTYFDGVPQLSFATSNIEFLDVQDIEFIRGPQATLYGRNSLGGIINVNSNRPSNKLSIESTSTVGNFQYYDERTTVNLPVIKDVLSVRASGGYSARNGYTKNDVTGNDVDSREAQFGKLQVMFTPIENLELTLRLNGERDRDGDYPLGDLAAIRKRPWHVSHGFEGDSLRDVSGASLTATYYTEVATVTLVTGFQNWRSQDVTGLDFTPLDLIRRQNREHENDFTQEFRAASPTGNPIVINDQAKVSWVAGIFLFSSDYGQQASNTFRPAAVSVVGLPFAFTQFDNAALSSMGVGIFSQGTLTLFDKVDLIAGVRLDVEHNHANLSSQTDSPFLPTSSQRPSADFENVSTRFGAAYHWTGDLMSYVDASQGYKAGGFNATSPANRVAFGPERAWTYEVGTKSSWFKNRLTANIDYFYVDWRHMQLDVPTGSPGVFFIDNVGQSHSQGVELELVGKPLENLQLFGGASYLKSQFDNYVQPSGVSARGHELPFAPDVTWNIGAEYSLALCKAATVFIRGEEFGSGSYSYDASNAARQGAYAMTNVRVGVRGPHWSLQGYVDNVFEARTVPLAFPDTIAPSGYVGESGIPRLFGVTLRVEF